MSRILLLFWSLLLLSLTTLNEMVNGFSTLSSLSLSSAKSLFGKEVVKNSTTRSTTYLCRRGGKQQKRTMLSSSSSSNKIDIDSEEDDPFTKLEYTNWQQGVDAYQKGFGPLTNQAVTQLLKQARFPFPTTTTTGESSSSSNNNNSNKSKEYHLLDVACGPGQVLLEAISTTKTNFNFNHKFTGLDFSSNFIQLAKQNLKHHHHQQQQQQQQQAVVEVDFVEGDAQNMSCFDENDKFDCVVCNFGILHLSSPSKFLEEAYRVLKPGGHIAYSVWAEPPATEGFDLILNAIKACGTMDVKLPDGPPFFQYANFEESAKSLENAGFGSIEIIQYDQMIWSNVNSGQQLFDIFYEGTARTRELLMKQSPTQLSKIQQQLNEQFALKTSKGPLKMPIVISSGMKPL